MIKLIQVQWHEPYSATQIVYSNHSPFPQHTGLYESDKSYASNQEMACDILGITLNEYKKAFPEKFI